MIMVYQGDCEDKPKYIKWSETLAHGFYAKIHVSTYAAGGQLTPNPWG